MRIVSILSGEGLDMRFAVAAHEEFAHELSEMGLSYQDAPVSMH